MVAVLSGVPSLPVAARVVNAVPATSAVRVMSPSDVPAAAVTMAPTVLSAFMAATNASRMPDSPPGSSPVVV